MSLKLMSHNTPVRPCVRCGYPFILVMRHIETGHDIQICASCKTPVNLHDAVGLEIMEKEGETNPPSKVYAEAWRRLLAKPTTSEEQKP